MTDKSRHFNPGASIADCVHIRLFEAQTLMIGREWNTPNVQSTFWRLYLNRSDGASLLLDGGEFPITAGRVCFVPAGVRFSCSNTAEFEHFYVHFDLLQVPFAAMAIAFSQPIELSGTSGLEHEARAVAADIAGASDLRSQCRLKALIYNALAWYLGELPEERRAAIDAMVSALAPLQPALDRIERDLASPLRNADLAALCFVSEDHFIRRFRESLRTTPASYVQDRRVTRAAQRLLFSGASIEVIAEETGFGNRYYFTRVFTRRIGISPAAYRALSGRH